MHDNLKHLGLETLDVVNLRVGGLERPTPGSIAEPFTVLAELRRQGLIRHLGVSNVSAEQLTEARSIAQVVCVQNNYNVATRNDRELVDRCAREGIAYTPFFPSEGLRRCSQRCSSRSRLDSVHRPGRSRWHGYCSTPPRSC